MSQINIKLPEELHDRLRIYSIRTKRDIKDIIPDSISYFIDKNEKGESE